MKLNPDCVRDVMLKLEDITKIDYKDGRFFFYSINCASLHSRNGIKEKYEMGELAYTLIQLAEDGYIKMDYSHSKDHPWVNMGNIFYVTPKGHSFISRVSSEISWKEKIKPCFETIGNISLSVIEAIASGIADAAISNLLQK